MQPGGGETASAAVLDFAKATVPQSDVAWFMLRIDSVLPVADEVFPALVSRLFDSQGITACLAKAGAS